MVRLEVCVDSPEGLTAAVAGGADRIELCAALTLGGLTPAPGLLAQAALSGLPVMAMVRARPGDFVCSGADLEAMVADIHAVRAAGLQGVVLGASMADGRLDLVALARLRAECDGLQVVLHRAFDLVPDMAQALEQVIALGFDRVLTSGGALRVIEGLDRLAQVYRMAAGRIEILPGSGITPQNVAQVLAAVPVPFVHASCAAEITADPRVMAMGFAPPVRRETDAGKVREMQAVLAGL